MKKAFTGINNLLDDMDANLAEELKYEPVIKREASIASDACDETKVDDVAPSPVVEKRKRISPATSPPLSKRKRNEKRIVDEDDYLFATNSSGIENHLLIVREENNKEYAREYLYNKTKFYYCRSCKKNGKAIYAAAHDDLHGKFVVRVPLDDQHCDSCIPVEYEKLKSEAYSRIPHSGSKKKQNVAPTTMVNNVNFSWSQVIADQRNAGTNACSSKSTTPAPKFDERPQTLQGLIEAQTEETVDPIPDLFPPQPGVLENMLLPFPSVRLVPESQWDFSVDPTNHYYDGKLIVKDASDSIWGRQYTFASPSKNGTLIFKCCCCDVNPFNCNVYLVRDENEKISAFEFILVGHSNNCQKVVFADVIKGQQLNNIENPNQE